MSPQTTPQRLRFPVWRSCGVPGVAPGNQDWNSHLERPTEGEVQVEFQQYKSKTKIAVPLLYLHLDKEQLHILNSPVESRIRP